MDYNLIRHALQDITFSETEVAKILKIGKPKVRQMLGTQIRAEQSGIGNSRIKCNAYDVLKPIIEQAMLIQ